MTNEEIIQMYDFANGFESLFNQLVPYGRTSEFHDRVINECDWSESTYWKKKKGYVKVRKPEIILLKQIFTEYLPVILKTA